MTPICLTRITSAPRWEGAGCSPYRSLVAVKSIVTKSNNGSPVRRHAHSLCSGPLRRLSSNVQAKWQLVTSSPASDRRTGLHFTPGDADHLAAKVESAWADPEEMAAMGRAAPADYKAKYTAERNYSLLMEIYQRATATHRALPT